MALTAAPSWYDAMRLHIAQLMVLSASKDVGPFIVCSKILRKKHIHLASGLLYKPYQLLQLYVCHVLESFLPFFSFFSMFCSKYPMCKILEGQRTKNWKQTCLLDKAEKML